jgi:hypothetical protein
MLPGLAQLEKENAELKAALAKRNIQFETICQISQEWKTIAISHQMKLEEMREERNKTCEPIMNTEVPHDKPKIVVSNLPFSYQGQEPPKNDDWYRKDVTPDDGWNYMRKHNRNIEAHHGEWVQRVSISDSYEPGCG